MTKSTVREFDVTTNFQVQALKPGGLSLSDALQKAEQNLATLRRRFEHALAEQTENLKDVAARAADDPAWRDQLKRKCIDLSDAATTLGFGLVAFVAAHLRDACDSPGGADRYEELVARHVEAMRRFAGDEFRRAQPSDVARLAADLSREPESR